jgi:hypothetical protein
VGHQGFAGALVVMCAALGTPIWAARKVEDVERPYWRTNLFKRVFTDQKYLLTRWLPQEVKQPWFDATLGMSFAIMIQSGSTAGGGWDVTVGRGISGGAGPGVKSASHVLTAASEGPVAAALLGITYLSSRRAHNDRLSEASSLAAESLADAGIWIVVLKAAAARMRPDNPDAGRFFQYGRADNNSFPSGHAMGAFSVASVFAGVYRDTRWVPWLSYGLATLIGGARLALGRHLPSDVIIGAVFGASIGRGVVARSREMDAVRVKGAWGPVLGPEGRGIGIGWSYAWK